MWILKGRQREYFLRFQMRKKKEKKRRKNEIRKRESGNKFPHNFLVFFYFLLADNGDGKEMKEIKKEANKMLKSWINLPSLHRKCLFSIWLFFWFYSYLLTFILTIAIDVYSVCGDARVCKSEKGKVNLFRIRDLFVLQLYKCDVFL